MHANIPVFKNISINPQNILDRPPFSPLQFYIHAILLVVLIITGHTSMAGEMSIIASETWPACDSHDEGCGPPDASISNPYKIVGTGIATIEILVIPYYVSTPVYAQILWNGQWGGFVGWWFWRNLNDGYWELLESESSTPEPGYPHRFFAKYRVTNAKGNQETRLVAGPQRWYGALGGFTQYASTNTIRVTFTPDEEGFSDVPPSSWAYDYIQAIRDEGITGGCGNGNYCPKDFVTREQMAAFLIRAILGDPDEDYCNGVDPFLDVAAEAWSCPHIKSMVELNITGGCGQGNYCPQGLVTREQMAVFIVRALEGDPSANYCNGVAPFDDVSPSSWSCGHIKRLVEMGITQGCSSGSYCPGNEVNREQMAAFLARAFLGME